MTKINDLTQFTFIPKLTTRSKIVCLKCKKATSYKKWYEGGYSICDCCGPIGSMIICPVCEAEFKDDDEDWIFKTI